MIVGERDSRGRRERERARESMAAEVLRRQQRRRREVAEAEERGGRRERGVEDVGVSQKSSIFVVLSQGGAGR